MSIDADVTEKAAPDSYREDSGMAETLDPEDRNADDAGLDEVYGEGNAGA